MLVLGASTCFLWSQIMIDTDGKHIVAYYVRVLPPPDQTHEAKLTLGGVISVLMVYIFAFFFGVSLGPISWNVCSEVS